MLGKSVDKYPLLAMLSTGMGLPKGIPTQMVSDVEFRTLSEHPMIADFLIQGDDGAGSAAELTTTTIYISVTDPTGDITNANRLLRVGDLLAIPSQQQNQTTAAGTVAASAEVVKVSAINAAGDVVTVTRNIGSTATAANVAAGSGNTLRAFSVGAAYGETDRSRDALVHAVLSQTNYIQKFQEEFSVSNDVRNIDLVGGDPLTREQNQKRVKFLEDIERAVVWGKRSQTFANSVATHLTGGLISYIAGDTTTYATYTAANDLVSGNGSSRIWVPGAAANLDVNNLTTFTERLYEEGSSNKVLLAGSGFISAWIRAFEGYWRMPMTEDTAGSIGFGFSSYKTPFSSVPLRLLAYPMFKGAARNDALVVDLDYVQLVNLPGNDIHIWKGNGGNGLQENDSDTIKWAWRAKLGVNVTYQLAHAYVTGLQNVDGTLSGANRTVGTLDPSNT